MPNRISILILTYNRADDLLELLKNLALQANKDKVLEEILVWNNASTDSYTEVEDYINSHAELKAKYIYSRENLGVARGRNELMKMAKGDIFMTIDDDMELPNIYGLDRLSQTFDKPVFKEANTGIITFKVVYYDTKELQVTAFPHKKFDKYVPHPQFFTAFFAGGANIMKREVIDRVGLYPTDFHYGMEEYDLLYRVLNAGFTIGYDNEVIIEHKESPLGRQPTYQKLQMQWINKSKVAWRYLPFTYFMTTSFSWSFQFLRIAKGHLGTYLGTWWQVFKIPFTEKRHVVSRKTLKYLKSVEARLWY
jgi:GT2 family glycosyltransferase